ncbi:MAG: IS30 family transposase, partial [Alphaproteobacteria bacterium]|nr:IS30 family transposase [Alphaproteobacteria bacterium]
MRDLPDVQTVHRRGQVMPALVRLAPAVEAPISGGEHAVRAVGVCGEAPDAGLVVHAVLAVRPRPGLAEILGEPDRHADRADIEFWFADSSSQCIILWKGEGVTSCTHERLLMSRYRRVTYEDRCQIYALSQDGACQEAIARVLGLSQSTVSRELRRNRGQRGYRFKQAETKAQARQAIRHKPRKLTASVRRKVEAKLRQMRWSPEQISGWLREQGIGLSHER